MRGVRWWGRQAVRRGRQAVRARQAVRRARQAVRRTVRVAAVGAAFVLAAAAACAPARYAALNGFRMYYEVHGRGPVLVLLHGGMGYGGQFVKQQPFLQQYCRVVIPDLCAQGRSGDRAGPLSYHAMAEDVVALLDRLEVAQADVWGWSDGGVVALDLAIHHPDRVRKLVTFGAHFAPDGLNPTDAAWNATATPASLGPQARRDYQSRAPDPEHFEAATNKILEMWRTQPRFTLEQLGAIRAPALVCAGENDVVRRDHTEALAAAIPGARLWIVPGGSHSVLLEQPDLVNHTVLGFLSE